jgi:hypothetical protein
LVSELEEGTKEIAVLLKEDDRKKKENYVGKVLFSFIQLKFLQFLYITHYHTLLWSVVEYTQY